MQTPWSETLSVRPLAETDLTPVAKIEQQEPTPWQRAAIAAELGQNNSLQLVACAGLELIGWGCCRFVDDEAELLKLAVSQTYRRSGVATHLLDCLESNLHAAGVTTLHLEVRKANHAALSFYLEAGFTETGRRIRYYRQPEDDALLYSKTICKKREQ